MTGAIEHVTSLAPTQMKASSAVSAKLMVMELTSAVVATVEALAGADLLVGLIQIKLHLVPSVSICLLLLRRRQCSRPPQHQDTQQLLLRQPQHPHRRPPHCFAVSVRPMVMELTSVVAATVEALADVDLLVVMIQIKLHLAPSVRIRPRRPHHRRPLQHQTQICRQGVAAHGLVRMRKMSVATAQRGARPVLQIARHVMVIGPVLMGRAQHLLPLLFQ